MECSNTTARWVDKQFTEQRGLVMEIRCICQHETESTAEVRPLTAESDEHPSFTQHWFHQPQKNFLKLGKVTRTTEQNEQDSKDNITDSCPRNVQIWTNLYYTS